MGRKSVMKYASLGYKGVDRWNCLAASDRMSVAVFQGRPSKLTVVFGSQVLSWLVIPLSLLMFVDHDLK